MPHSAKSIERSEEATVLVLDALGIQTSLMMLTSRDVLWDKLEKICYEIKFEASEDGGCVVKLTSECHTKGDVELNDDDKSRQRTGYGLYKACEVYLTANTDHVCT
ncbi:UNVERIFIED_CONTAM: Major allergen Pru ar 1 [Sesamum calycinum]|uniref:Major allergen Pru ar 1 n=1 Tax=Sesamum calycinum TaxID=2727403 RepID=A0AAW2QLK6_9LAMI